ncbi:Z1 domain-containing protein [Bradyrhizobium pachyrhizi]|uniref:Z1 domain-containing protein n=1 Tax=Bradyrhizobium pachyrhizi TaxID=280333 RepID=UPI0024B1F757|nr:Z1 domain-containing protein [Bradyrhizobium pachyrhizi]WFU55724.1 Z1 domain-containing protein [Bradyrhizobium pachyrhizi]
MSSVEDAIGSMALMMLRQRHPDTAVGREEIEKAVNDCAKLLAKDIPAGRIAAIVQELETRLIVKVGRPTKLIDERGHVAWYFGDRKEGRRFFKRYGDFLLQDQGWPPAAIDAIDLSTDLIMEQIEDPNRDGPWDRRGLVVGHVQFGKTANYAGLASKAADAGYKLIIVLAGMHNALRQQTQRRMDRDFLGYNTTPTSGGVGFTRIGVGELDKSIHAEHLTTQAANGDFNRAFADNLGIGVQQRPVLLVVKKNARILENLNNWVSEVLAPRGDTEARPLLLIDDEADQASVDTGEQQFLDDDTPDPEYEPKRINGQIRRLLAAFSRSAYVAYTATPFANVLIHDAGATEEHGDDVFPRSFIINLPSPSNYVGSSLLFGIDGSGSDAAQEPLDVTRDVDQDEEGWIAVDHKKGYAPRYQGEDRIPPSLEDAILSFVLACATRAARGQRNVHNSMLVHVSRYKDVHQAVYRQVEEWFSEVKRKLKYRAKKRDPILDRLRGLWERDFAPTSATIRAREIGQSLPATEWADVERELSYAADKIKPQVVNSEIRDALDYDGNAAQGLNVIAIGGDKLSRGLTLEGLTVSYFLRASKMYDSLMQMGRWFGYRPGYVDLCRIYMTPDLRLWFRHVATSAEELRERLDHMAMIGATPEQYGLRIQSHDILLVTAPNKMRHSREFQVSFQGEAKIQTVFFNDQATNQTNANSITSVLDRLGPTTEPQKQAELKSSDARRVWKGVAGAEVANLLASLRFPDEAWDVNAGRLSSYIREQLGAGELTDWTVAVLSGSGEPLPANGWTFTTIERAPLPRGEASGRYVVKTVLSPRDEAIDLDQSEFARALAATNQKRADAGKEEASTPDGPEIRKVRGENPKRALLLLYPLSPKNAKLDAVDVPIFGVVVSFPDSRSGRSIRYRFNTVEQRLEPV